MFFSLPFCIMLNLKDFLRPTSEIPLKYYDHAL